MTRRRAILGDAVDTPTPWIYTRVCRSGDTVGASQCRATSVTESESVKHRHHRRHALLPQPSLPVGRAGNNRNWSFLTRSLAISFLTNYIFPSIYVSTDHYDVYKFVSYNRQAKFCTSLLNQIVKHIWRSTWVSLTFNSTTVLAFAFHFSKYPRFFTKGIVIISSSLTETLTIFLLI